jgi:uncharacterized protein with FMN-binding domain
MSGTRIFVFKLRDIIKYGLIAVLGLAVVIAIVVAVTSGGKPSAVNNAAGMYAPGTYTAQIVLHNKPVNISVTVTDREIIAIEMSDMEHDQEVFYPLFRPTIESLAQEIIRRQSTEVPIDSYSAVTSQILLDAVNAALSQARAD